MIGQIDRQTPDHYRDNALHTMQAVTAKQQL